MPSVLSMRAYVPIPGNQGVQGSCVGWATAYAARTLIAARAAEVTNPQAKRQMTLSPAFIFNQIQRTGCENGILISDALALMTEQGVASLASFPYRENSCVALPDARVLNEASEFRIKSFTRLWGSKSRNRHVSARRALAAGHPVVIGMFLPESFVDFDGSDYFATDEERAGMQALYEGRQSTLILGGHAMTVVGYDDAREGGSFEIVNSWGPDWGDAGFFWINYRDFNHFVTQGYEMIPQAPPEARAAPLSASITLRHITGDILQARPESEGYRITRALPSGTRFRVEAQSDTAANVYVIGGDATGDYVALFPRGGRVSPHLAAGETLLLPGPTEQHYTRLNDSTGTDFYILLIARDPLSVAGVAGRMAGAGGDVQARLAAALGDRLIPANYVTHMADAIGAQSDSAQGDVIALVLSIDHVAPDPALVDRTAPLITLTAPAPEAFDDADGPILVPSSLVQLDGIAQDESAIAALTVTGAVSTRFSSRGPFRAELALPDGPGPHGVTITATDALGQTATRHLTFTIQN
ncbi:C1 family peptidase [Antarctobacter sp.]|uniref:C1 family peptidase n=1 Tax=Antarctobacter sp. TaxID=1872577 RepID=UPI002B26978C|nr:C1 family peptidase [Antarctobacter sp.]